MLLVCYELSLLLRAHLRVLEVLLKPPLLLVVHCRFHLSQLVLQCFALMLAGCECRGRLNVGHAAKVRRQRLLAHTKRSVHVSPLCLNQLRNTMLRTPHSDVAATLRRGRAADQEGGESTEHEGTEHERGDPSLPVRKR